MPRRNDLKPFLQKHIYLLPLLGLFYLLVSPVLLPILIMIRHKEELLEYFTECFDAFRKYDS